MAAMTNGQAQKAQKKELSSRILRDRLRGVPEAPLQLSRQHVQLQNRLKEVLSEGPKTVPDIAETTGLPTSEVFWHLMSLKKYGEIIEGGEHDSYVVYALKTKEEGKP